eukprot:4604660-Prymnesium_polylepis.1
MRRRRRRLRAPYRGIFLVRVPLRTEPEAERVLGWRNVAEVEDPAVVRLRSPLLLLRVGVFHVRDLAFQTASLGEVYCNSRVGFPVPHIHDDLIIVMSLEPYRLEFSDSKSKAARVSAHPSGWPCVSS